MSRDVELIRSSINDNTLHPVVRALCRVVDEMMKAREPVQEQATEAFEKIHRPKKKANA